MKKPRICIISFSDLKREPRVKRQINALKDKYEITTIGLKKSEVPGIEELEVSDNRTRFKKIRSQLTFLLSRIFKGLYPEYIESKYPFETVYEMLKEKRLNIIIAHSLDALVVAYSIVKRDGGQVFLDAHEYYPRQIEDHWFHRLFINPYKDFLCRRYLPRINAMTTVSYGIAEEFNRIYEVEPEIIMNAPEYQKMELEKVDPDNIRIIHHGLAHPSRNLEDMIHLMPLLDKRFHLTLMLVARDRRYFAQLKRLAKQICPERIDFREVIPFDNIIPAISEYDIQLIIYRPTSLKLKFSLPNKFFESIMAGLFLAIGPYPEMKRIIDEFGCGSVASSFKIIDVASLINGLTSEDIMKKKRASLEAARIFNAEIEMKKLLRIVEEILSKQK